jgi:hypothetical protein
MTSCRTNTRSAANAAAATSASTTMPATGVKPEAGAAQFAGFEAPPYREIRLKAGRLLRTATRTQNGAAYCQGGMDAQSPSEIRSSRCSQ